MAAQQRADLIADIYEAALDPESWPGFAAPFAKALDRQTAFFWIGDAGRITQGATHGLPADAMSRYVAYFKEVDLWGAAAIDRRLSLKAAMGSELVPHRRFMNSEFYFDYARTYDTVDAVGGLVPLGRGRIGVLGVHRQTRGRPFEPSDTARLESLLPHLQRALQLKERLNLSEASDVGLAALDALAFGAIVCDAVGRILFANAAAEGMAAAGNILLSSHGLSTPYPEESRRLAGLIQDAAWGGAGGGIVLRGRGNTRLFGLVASLPRRFAEEGGHALVTIRAAAARPHIGPSTLRLMFGMTPAEAEVTLALLSGCTFAEIGMRRSVSENTLRTQLGSILRKTETANQRDLVRLLSLLPPMPLD
ncbi:MAG: helix-turn-helix transcriptional regulator [Methyloceanibacter sp.]|uniref:helix-turn-helix transcriptional regulator n=1 Tax=Methyloceanibacter sp. TaxID=1965321 RepID=UPI003D6D2976